MKKYIIQVIWPVGNPTMSQLVDVLEGVEVDLTFQPLLIDKWEEKYVVRGKATEETVKEIEQAKDWIRFFVEPCSF